MADLPELLAPAGSPEALDAAIDAGADAVYFGGTVHNARMSAHNFNANEMRESIKKAHSYGVKCYITLNTLVTDRELDGCLDAAALYYEAGADGLIVADLGVASEIHKYIPDLLLHASTQASGHNAFAAAELKKLGFSRMVMAREASLCDIRKFTSASDIELEVFVHGALCMSTSGQCLFSSLIGGRSGNRGECAQPCRLPYLKNGKEYYPLSLKDLCLARHIPDLIDAKVASLKIEGRMKPPSYVHAVTSVYRRLLDERRCADDSELRYLSGVFSRSGFTDGYFTGKINASMLGVRSDKDKQNSRDTGSDFSGITRKIPIDISASFIGGERSSLTLTAANRSVTAYGDVPLAAVNAPMNREGYLRSLSKLGNTPFAVRNADIVCSDGLMVPVSQLNALRREAVSALLYEEPRKPVSSVLPEKELPHGVKKPQRTAVLTSANQLTDKAKAYFDRIYLPIESFNGETDSVVMPPIIFDREADGICRLLENAKKLGAVHILIGNIGHTVYAEKYGFTVHGDFRLNVTNTDSVTALEKLGINDTVLSPELTLPQIRDIKGNVAAVVYGRIPLMLLEKCAVCEIRGCSGRSTAGICRADLVDRKGVSFPVLRIGGHRNIIVNSLPTSMSDRLFELDRYGIVNRHFIFTVETPEEVDRVIMSFENNCPLCDRVRRISAK